jgi:hypothetical protein
MTGLFDVFCANLFCLIRAQSILLEEKQQLLWEIEK